MDETRAKTLIDNFAGRRLLVVGDLMLDRFIWGAVRRISPEAPVPVVEVDRESQHLGGAGNVVANIVALGAEAIPLGVIGDDANAELLLAEFALSGVDTSAIVRDPSRPTTTKTRIIAHSQQVVRADRERRHRVDPEIEEALAAAFLERLADANAVVVSDYDKGLLAGGLLEHLLGKAAERGVPVCLDPKIKRFASYRPLTVITPNHFEAELAAGMPANTDEELDRCARRIQNMLDGPAVLITRGEAGMSLLDRDGTITHIPTMAREVYDVTGAGDTVVATLALALSSGADVLDAAILANYAAGVVVGKVGTATLSRGELAGAVAGRKG